MEHICPNCGKELGLEDDKCECGFAYADTVSCPYKFFDKCYLRNGQACIIKGYDFEACEVYQDNLA